MRIKLGYPLLLRQIAEFADAFLIMSEAHDCLEAVTHLTTDSREVMPGDLFIALVSDRDDGHRYIHNAIANGASTIMCASTRFREATSACKLLCHDTMEALVRLARHYSESIPHRTIAVTGSVGKTTTRRFISSILSEAYRIHESPENYNNLLGTALLLLSMPRDTAYLIAECGMNHPGEIDSLSHLLSPDYAVITNVGISHIANLGSLEAIGREKLAILNGMAGGTLLCPGDDAYLRANAPSGTLFVSVSENGDHYCCNISEKITGTNFSYFTSDRQLLHLYIPTIGRHTLSAAALAIQLACEIGITDDAIKRGLARYRGEKMRQTILQVGPITILSDAYNACPASMRAACDAACIYQEHLGGRVHVLLGDMYELGSLTERSHREIGRLFASRGFQNLYFWGDYGEHYLSGTTEINYPSTRVRCYTKKAEPRALAKEIASALSAGDILLIKGSRGMHMERLLDPLKELIHDFSS